MPNKKSSHSTARPFSWVNEGNNIRLRVRDYKTGAEPILTGDFLTYGDARDVYRLHTVVDGVEYVSPIDAEQGDLLEQAEARIRKLEKGWRPNLWPEIVDRVEAGWAHCVTVEAPGDNNEDPLWAATFDSYLGARVAFEARAAEIEANIYWEDGATANLWGVANIGDAEGVELMDSVGGAE